MDLPYATLQDSLHYIKNCHVSRYSFVFFISCHHSSAAPLEWIITGDEAHTLQSKAHLCCSILDKPWGPMSGDMSTDRSQDMYNKRPLLWWAKEYNGRQILSVGRHVGCVSQNAIFFYFQSQLLYQQRDCSFFITQKCTWLYSSATLCSLFSFVNNTAHHITMRTQVKSLSQ